MGPFDPGDPSIAVRALAELRPGPLRTAVEDDLSAARLRSGMAVVDRHVIGINKASRADTSAQIAGHQRGLRALGTRPEQVDEFVADSAELLTGYDRDIARAHARLASTTTEAQLAAPNTRLAARIHAERERLGWKGARTLAFLPGAVLGAITIIGGITAANQELAVDAPQTVTTPITLHVDSYQQANAVNALATSLTESPQTQRANVAQDRMAVRPLLDLLHSEGGEVRRVVVTGKASPDAGPQQDMTQVNGSDVYIAGQRGRDGTEAFIAEAQRDHVTVDKKQVTTLGVDEVLQDEPLRTLTGDVKEVRKTQPGMTLNGMEAEYDSSQRDRLPGNVTADMKQSFTDQRGVGYEIDATVKKKSVKQNIVSKLQNMKIDGLPIEYLTAVLGLELGMFSMATFIDRAQGKLAKRRAQLEIGAKKKRGFLFW